MADAGIIPGTTGDVTSIALDRFTREYGYSTGYSTAEVS
jgi:hypothetical protein